jgi:hypothetical protein
MVVVSKPFAGGCEPNLMRPIKKQSGGLDSGIIELSTPRRPAHQAYIPSIAFCCDASMADCDLLLCLKSPGEICKTRTNALRMLPGMINPVR